MVFISGDVSDGSPNDVTMRMIIGDNWKKLTGAEQQVYKKKCSPGFQFDTYWASIIARYDALIAPNRTVEVSDRDSTKGDNNAVQPVVTTVVSDADKGMRHTEKGKGRVRKPHWFVDLLPTPMVVLLLAAFFIAFVANV